MENDKMVLKWLETKFEALDKLLDSVDKKCSDCRVHCDNSRDRCTPRIEALETKVASMQVSNWRGAIFIGSCTLIGIVVTLILWAIRG